MPVFRVRNKKSPGGLRIYNELFRVVIFQAGYEPARFKKSTRLATLSVYRFHHWSENYFSIPMPIAGKG